MNEQTAFVYDVFISYSHLQKDWVRGELLKRLERSGLHVCIDYRNFEIGVPTLINIERAVDQSRHTILVLTSAWINSEWTEFESLLAGSADPSGRRQKLLPLMLEECHPPSRIAYLHHADFRHPEEHESHFKHLLDQLARTVTIKLPNVLELAPFVAGRPITHPHQFFGHTRELRGLFDLWKRLPLQNAAIIGPRRSGKTSLLLYLKSITTTPANQLRSGQRRDWLPEPNRYQWVYVDFQDPRLGSQEGLLGYLLNSFKLPLRNKVDLDYFIEVVMNGLRNPTVILLDEIGVAMERYPELDDLFWESMRYLANNLDSLAFTLAAHELPVLTAHHTGHSSPFFNIFAYTTIMSPLTEDQARELIASSPLAFHNSDIDWIIEHSGRWPLLLQILCRERLISLEEGEDDDTWRTYGLQHLESFKHLLYHT